MPSFAALRAQRHSAWLAQLRQQVKQIISTPDPLHSPPDQVLLFGSRARGTWDGLSDTDLLVIANDAATAEFWSDQLHGQLSNTDVLALTHQQWSAMPQSNSAIWRAITANAQPLLEPR